jgi:hypothetical protein
MLMVALSSPNLAVGLRRTTKGVWPSLEGSCGQQGFIIINDLLEDDCACVIDGRSALCKHVRLFGRLLSQWLCVGSVPPFRFQPWRHS